MAVEKRRGCGYRKVGGIYLVGEGIAVPCDKMPYPLEVCPTCGQGIKFSRGFTWLNPLKFFGVHENCRDLGDCPICKPTEKAGLMWVGSKFYTKSSFIEEAREMGISKRIHFVPKGLELGKTWVLLAYRERVSKDEVRNEIFYAFRPTKVEMLINQSEATQEKIEELQKRGITPIIVPDNDPDHHGSVWEDLKKGG